MGRRRLCPFFFLGVSSVPRFQVEILRSSSLEELRMTMFCGGLKGKKNDPARGRFSLDGFGEIACGNEF